MMGRSDKGSLERHRGDTEERKKQRALGPWSSIGIGRQTIRIGEGRRRVHGSWNEQRKSDGRPNWIHSLRENGFADLI